MIGKLVRSKVAKQLLSDLVSKLHRRGKPFSLTSVFIRKRAGKPLRLYALLRRHLPISQLENRPFSNRRGFLFI
jgi:hypothetical protein